MADPAPSADVASRTVLLDAFVANVDRTPRNPNLLSWHGRLWLIDHGASLYFHHGWTDANPLEGSDDPVVEVKHHVLLRAASALEDAAPHLRATMTDHVIERVIDAIPADWLTGDRGFADARAQKAAYVAWLHARVTAIPILLEEALRARSELV